MRRIWMTVPLLGLVLVLGIGCGQEEPAPEPQEPEVDQVQEKNDDNIRIALTNDQHAYLMCVRAGHRIEIEIEDVGVRRIYCVSRAGKCPALSLLNDTCEKLLDAEDVSVPQLDYTSTDGLHPGPRHCEPVARPVCGADGKTYTNECVAIQYRVSVAHNGACGDPQPKTEDQKSDSQAAAKDAPQKVSVIPQQEKGSSVQPTDTSAAPPAQQPREPLPPSVPEWVHTAISLLEDGDSNIPAHIEQCSGLGGTYYYQFEDCPSCLNVLYSSAGDVVCYPAHDEEDACPNDFSIQDRSCDLIWSR
jgi:hypothetical protein